MIAVLIFYVKLVGISKFNPLRTKLIILIFLLQGAFAWGQPAFHFYHLTTADGLSDNSTLRLDIDKSGNLWIATADGLNMFNGKKTTRYHSRENPSIKSDRYRLLMCDEQNRIWTASEEGHVMLIDEKRKFHRVKIDTSGNPKTIRRFLIGPGQQPLILTTQGQFIFKPGKFWQQKDSLTPADFMRLDYPAEKRITKSRFFKAFQYDNETGAFVGDSVHYKVNFRTMKVDSILRKTTIILKWNEQEALAYNRKTDEFELINWKTGACIAPYFNNADQFGNRITGFVLDAQWISPSRFLMTVPTQGLFLYDTLTKQLTSYVHSAADPHSIGNNNVTDLTVDSSGWVFTTTFSNGISYFKHNAVVGQKLVFEDKKGNNYDGLINKMASIDNDTYYIGASHGLLKWKRSTNVTSFLDFRNAAGEPVSGKDDIVGLMIDSRKRIWFSTFHHGIFVLDLNGNLIRHFPIDKSKPNYVFSGSVNGFLEHSDGNMWVYGADGIYTINLETLVPNLSVKPGLELLQDISVGDCLFETPTLLWIATTEHGLWRYETNTNAVQKYDKSSGFISNMVNALQKDSKGNIYAGTDAGIWIKSADGKTMHIGVNNGLLNPRADELMVDRQERIWIGNENSISCFNPGNKSIRVFDERYGLSIQGFRRNASYMNAAGEMFWGTERGLQYFDPDVLYVQQVKVRSIINSIESRDINAMVTGNETYSFAASDNSITFNFSTIDFSKHQHTYFEYMLEGVDPGWVLINDQNAVRYHALPSGTHTFKLRASNDKINWVDAENEITIVIATPWWKQWWFRLMSAIAGIVLVWYIIRFYRKQQAKEKEELETEVVVNYFASQINNHRNTDELLWDVAKNCISRLHFEDCVIYLVDEERKMLIQKAAYGPKNPVDYKIHQPIEIPVGKGIVGAVAQAGKPVVVGDTQQDKRYIVDDVSRHSELAIPVIVDGKVIGVIDSEHSQRNFFTARHLQILNTVAVLVGNQIQRTQAEAEKQQAQLDMIANRQKATESRLQSLRLQMNPHFLFNALNSIQQMILANEDVVATKYLSRFSKLLRSILIQSDKEQVTLREEIDILNLYIELEAIRFKESFQYSINCDEEIDKDEIRIPNLLVQPFVENAIWHGLMHKEGEKKLLVSFTDEGDVIKCIVEDNGVGRAKAASARISAAGGKAHKSKGIEVSMERLKTLKNARGESGTINIIDLVDDDGAARGTRVEIIFPIQN